MIDRDQSNIFSIFYKSEIEQTASLYPSLNETSPECTEKIAHTNPYHSALSPSNSPSNTQNVSSLPRIC